MLRSESIYMIREKHTNGKSNYAIGKELGISKNTAKKYSNSTVCRASYSKRSSKLDAFKSEINRLMENGVFNCVAIMEHISELGYEGKISILKDYVRPFRQLKQIPAVRRYETEPGYQAQMDWGVCSYLDSKGIEHKIYAFVMILSHSRMRYTEFSKRCDLHSLTRCMVNAFEYFGGVPETVLTDNMKTVILGREAGKPIWNPAFLDFANSIGFIPKVCQVRRPQTKGKVERLVRYLKDNFMAGRSFCDFKDLNLQVKAWCDKVNAKISASTGESAAAMLSEEPLKALPDTNISNRYRYESRLVSKDGFISYDGVRYGVFWEYCGRHLTVREMSGVIEIFDNLSLVASYPLEGRSGKSVTSKDQYAGLAEKHGMPIMPMARLVENAVEKRSLSVYENILEVTNARI